MSDRPAGPTGVELSPPDATGVPSIDEALAELSDLDTTPLSEHQPRLAQAHSVLHDALGSDQVSPQAGARGQDTSRP